MTLLDVRDVGFSYDGSVSVLKDVTFTVEPGTIVGLIGPNGSGKSTLIRLLFDLLQSQRGSITLGGYDHTSVAARGRAIYLASNDYLPQFLTGREHLEMLSRLYGVPFRERAARDLFRRFSMEGRADDLIEDFSHGMRKKTQLISALLLRRPLTVIDETLNGVDIEALHLCQQELARLRDEGNAVLLCTHDFALLERLADSILFLDLGELVVAAPTSSLVAAHGSLSDMVFTHLDHDGR